MLRMSNGFLKRYPTAKTKLRMGMNILTKLGEYLSKYLVCHTDKDNHQIGVHKQMKFLSMYSYSTI